MGQSYDGKIITEYGEFVHIVQDIGFMPFSKNSLGFINLDCLTHSEQWHTDLPSDPWPWRVTIEEDHKAAYAKLFLGKPGFISLAWYPIFIAARRNHREFEDFYADGLISIHAKQIYQLFQHNDVLATHEIKALCGFTKDTASKYESAMIELQMMLLITTNGMKRKVSTVGEPYGWPATAYSTVEHWAGPAIYEQAMEMNTTLAQQQILDQIFEVCPSADLRKARKFAGLL